MTLLLIRVQAIDKSHRGSNVCTNIIDDMSNITGNADNDVITKGVVDKSQFDWLNKGEMVTIYVVNIFAALFSHISIQPRNIKIRKRNVKTIRKGLFQADQPLH